MRVKTYNLSKENLRNAGQVLEEIEDYLDEEGKEQKVEETKKVRNIRPMSSIDVSEILDGWNGSFNRDISNPTDQWYLAAFPKVLRYLKSYR